MNKKLSIVILLLSFVSLKLSAQEFSFDKLSYYQRELHVNPAYAGSKNLFSATSNIQKQWINIDKSPDIQRFQIHSPIFDNKMGLGLTMYNETYGITHKFGFFANYAYKIHLEQGVLSLGLCMGAQTHQDNYAKLETPMPDPIFSENTGLMLGFNCGFGAYYSDSNSDRFYMGFSMPVLIDNSLKQGEMGLTNKLDFEKTPFYLTGGYVFKLGETFGLKPAALLGYSSKYQFAYNISLTGYYSRDFWLGAMVRYKNQAGGIVGFNVLDCVALNYVYTFNYASLTSKIGQSAIHEISLRIELDFKGRRSSFKFF